MCQITNNININFDLPLKPPVNEPPEKPERPNSREYMDCDLGYVLHLNELFTENNISPRIKNIMSQGLVWYLALRGLHRLTHMDEADAKATFEETFVDHKYEFEEEEIAEIEKCIALAKKDFYRSFGLWDM